MAPRLTTEHECKQSCSFACSQSVRVVTRAGLYGVLWVYTAPVCADLAVPRGGSLTRRARRGIPTTRCLFCVTSTVAVFSFQYIWSEPRMAQSGRPGFSDSDGPTRHPSFPPYLWAGDVAEPPAGKNRGWACSVCRSDQVVAFTGAAPTPECTCLIHACRSHENGSRGLFSCVMQ